MSQLEKIVKLTKSQYESMMSASPRQISYTGGTHVYDENNLYVTTDETFSAEDLGNDFILPVSKGGTGKTQFTSGSLLVGNGQNALTEIGATNQNTVNTIVKRDSSGNFSAGTITASLSGNATTSYYPYGFSSRPSSAAWGNTTGTYVTSWDIGSSCIAFMKDNPSSGKLSAKIDGRFYIAEGAIPVAGLKAANSYWGMTGPDGEDNIWIRTTSQGIIPYQSGGASAGHCQLGTDTWYFSKGYIQDIYGTLNGNATTATTATNLSDNPSIQTSGTTQITITAGGKTSSAYTVPYATSAGSVAWANTGHPDTFPPTIGNTATTAMAGNTTVTNVAISADTTTNKNYALVFGTTPSDGTSPTAAKTEGLQKNSAKFYVNPSTGNIQATTFNGYTLAAASAKAIDTSISAASTSTNLPTSQAVASFVEGKGYLTSHYSAYLYAGANNATAHAAVSAGTNIYLCLRENNTQRSAVQIKQGTNMTISSDANGIITFASTDTNNAVTQNVSTANKKYGILLSAYETSASTTTATSVNRDSKVYVNPSLNQVAAGQLTIHDKASTPVEKVTMQWNSTDSALEFVFA